MIIKDSLAVDRYRGDRVDCLGHALDAMDLSGDRYLGVDRLAGNVSSHMRFVLWVIHWLILKGKPAAARCLSLLLIRVVN